MKGQALEGCYHRYRDKEIIYIYIDHVNLTDTGTLIDRGDARPWNSAIAVVKPMYLRQIGVHEMKHGIWI